MRDSFGREIEYLRISLTSACNLRCLYCRPQGQDDVGPTRMLSARQIVRIAMAAAGLGIRKIRLTGGEPLLFPGLPDLVAKLKKIPGIAEVSLTTNGVLLAGQLPELMEAGLDGVNISLDTADREEYRLLTGGDCLQRVLTGLDGCLQAKINVKINCVAADFALYERETGAKKHPVPGWMSVVALAGEKHVPVRLIELMPIGMGSRLCPLSVDEIRSRLEAQYGAMKRTDCVWGNGPAVYYHLPGLQTKVGFIGALHEKFCDSCNRIRLTSSGFLKGCLCYSSGISVDPAFSLPDEEQEEALRGLLKKVIQEKPAAHCFEHPDRMTERNTMEKIGG